MVTAEEARRLRVTKGSVNHETYKGIYAKIQNRIKVAAARGDTSIQYRIPPFVPGRPMYDITHALRYNRDKLKLAGFRVVETEDVLGIDWRVVEKPPPPKSKKAKPKAKPPEKPLTTLSSFGTSAGISSKLADLKKKLNL
jgi:hypothetical protein